MKKILFILLITIPVLLLSSCLKNQEDIFDIEATERINERLAEFKGLLASAPNGWHLQYYPHENQNYGGYNYLISFDSEGFTEVAFEMTRNEPVVESMYDVIYEYGPMLTFNTYNSNMHYFSEGSDRRYQGYKGDYEFMLQDYDAQTQTITLKGKRSDNIMKMTMLPENYDWTTYLDDVYKLRVSAFYGAYYLIVNGIEVGTVLRNNRIMTFTYPSGYETNIDGELVEVYEEVKMGITFNPEGITFYEPLEVNSILIKGINAKTFEWNEASGELRSIDGNGEIILKGYIPDGYFTYEELLGSGWRWDGDYPGTLTQEIYLETFIFNHTTPSLVDYPFVFNYNSSFGGFEVTAQDLGTWNGFDLKLCGNGDRFIGWSESVSAYYKAVDATGKMFIGTDSKEWGTDKVLLWVIGIFNESGSWTEKVYENLIFRNLTITRQ